jgi:hypothetical protein
MNTITIIPDLIIQLLQKQNIKRKTIPKIEVAEKEKPKTQTNEEVPPLNLNSNSGKID